MKGRAAIKKGKMYFDDNGWALVKRVAKRTRKSPKFVVIQALRRMVKVEAKNASI